jgi:Ca-activated chloride channel homolog
MVSISFVYPGYLLFLFLIPLYIFVHLATLKATRSKAMKFANFEAISRIKGVDFFSKNIMVLGLSISVITFLVLSLSGLTFHTTIDASVYSFVLAIDSSQSMGAIDMKPNRMEAAKAAALDFVDSVPITTKVGVISFSGNSIIEQDLTNDKNLMRNGIKSIEISNIGGTDLIEAVVTSTNLLKGEETRAIILLSDGQINVGSIPEALLYANENNVLIHTIGLGTEAGGRASYGISKLDEDSLKALSYNTNGEFFRAVDENDLKNSLSQSIEKTRALVGINLSKYLLIIAIVLFTLEYILINSRYARII